MERPSHDGRVPLTPELCLEDAAWLRTFARALVGNADDADDLVQDTFHHLSAQRESLARVRHPRAYLRNTLRFLASNHRRASWRRRDREALVAQENATVAPSPAEALERVDVMRRVLAELDRLPAHQRDVLALRYVEGLSPTEIAKQRGTTLSTVHAALTRGLALLRQRLDASEGGRKAWSATLLPFAGLERSAVRLPVASAASAAPPLIASVVAMKTLTLSLTCALGLGAVLWSLRDDGAPSAPLEDIASPDANEADADLAPPSQNTQALALIEGSRGTRTSNEQDDRAAAAGRPATISGRLVDAATKEPIPRMRVQLIASGGAASLDPDALLLWSSREGRFEFPSPVTWDDPLRLQTYDEVAGIKFSRSLQEWSPPFEGDLEIPIGPTYALDEASSQRVAMDSHTRATLINGDGLTVSESTWLRRDGGTAWARFPPLERAVDMSSGPWQLVVKTKAGLERGSGLITRAVGIDPVPVHLTFERRGALNVSAVPIESEMDAAPMLELRPTSDEAARPLRKKLGLHEGMWIGGFDDLAPDVYEWTMIGFPEVHSGTIDIGPGERERLTVENSSLAKAARVVVIDATRVPDEDLGEWTFTVIDLDQGTRHLSLRPRRSPDGLPGMWHLHLGELPKGDWIATAQPEAGTTVTPGLLPIVDPSSQGGFVVDLARTWTLSVRATNAASGEVITGAKGCVTSGMAIKVLHSSENNELLTTDEAPADRASRVTVRAHGFRMESVELPPGGRGPGPIEVALTPGWRNHVYVIGPDGSTPASGVSVHVDGVFRGVTDEGGVFWLEGDGPPNTIEVALDDPALECRFSASSLKRAGRTIGDPLTGYLFLVGRVD